MYIYLNKTPETISISVFIRFANTQNTTARQESQEWGEEIFQEVTQYLKLTIAISSFLYIAIYFQKKRNETINL